MTLTPRRGRPHGDTGAGGVAGTGLPGETVQWHLMWSWRDGLQAEVADCRLNGRECGPEPGDRGKECGPKNALITVRAGFDCSPLVRHEVA